MKMRISKNNLASFLCGGVVCLTACISMSSNDVEKVIESRPVVSSMTLSPDVPSSVPFCGKLIDITRYDMREAYDRELSSFTYDDASDQAGEPLFPGDRADLEGERHSR